MPQSRKHRTDTLCNDSATQSQPRLYQLVLFSSNGVSSNRTHEMLSPGSRGRGNALDRPQTECERHGIGNSPTTDPQQRGAGHTSSNAPRPPRTRHDPYVVHDRRSDSRHMHVERAANRTSQCGQLQNSGTNLSDAYIHDPTAMFQRWNTSTQCRPSKTSSLSDEPSSRASEIHVVHAAIEEDCADGTEATSGSHRSG